jgi:GntR family transcriptional regulator, transcriptional repressor for pyruvate dehydrogenase complex
VTGKAKAHAVDIGEAATDAFAELIDASRRPVQSSDMGGPLQERRSISEQVANRIIEMIKSGNLKAGDRLPTEQQMGIAFGISRPPLREALKALTLMGMLESRQGGRYMVTDLSPSRLVAPFNVMLSVGDYDVNEHFEARGAVELTIVRLATVRATTEERQRILKHAVDGRKFLDDSVAFRLLDIEFHRSLSDAAKNRLLSAVAQGLYDIGLDVRRAASQVRSNVQKSVEQHIELAEAIMRGDIEAAASAYRRHLEHIRDTTVEVIAKSSTAP